MSELSVVTDAFYSDYGADPELADLVQQFVVEMPDRVGVLVDFAGQADWHGLARAAHQMKGAAGSYGFHPLTPFAARLESACKEGRAEESITELLCDLIEMCGRVRAGSPN